MTNILEAMTAKTENILRKRCYVLCGNSEDAEDLYQEVMFRAIKFADKFDGCNLQAWLMRIAFNLHINNYRKLRYKAQQFGQMPEIQDTDWNDGPSQMEFEEIMQQFEKLRPRDKVVLELVIDGYKYEEIAEKMQLPLGTIKSRIFKARQEFSKKLRYTHGYGCAKIDNL